MNDLPGLLLKAQANNEANAINREKLQMQEDAAYAELLLGNLSMQLESAKSDIADDKAIIEAIDEDFRNTTSNLPEYGDVEFTGGNAERLLNETNERIVGPYKDAIVKRSELVGGYLDEAAKYDAIRQMKEQDAKALDFLKANMLQNTMTIAASGGDLNMIDAEDFIPYWEQTLQPQLIEKGFIPEGEAGFKKAERFKNVWLGMLAPETSRMEQREKIIAFKSNKVKEMIAEKNLIDIEDHWNELDLTSRETILDIQFKKVDRVLDPIIGNLETSQVGSLIDSKVALLTQIEEDPEAAAGALERYWDEETIMLNDAYNSQAVKVGQMILGDIGGEAQDRNTTYKWVAEYFMEAVIAATDTTNPQKAKIIQALSWLDRGLKVQQVLNAEGGLETKYMEQNGKRVAVPRKIDPSLKKEILSWMGLQEYDFDQGVLGGVIELYNWGMSKQAESILKSFESDKPGVGDAGFIVPELPEGYYTPPAEPEFKGGTYQSPRSASLNQEVDNAVMNMLEETENDWII